MAAGVVAGVAKYFKRIPKIIIVEPDRADCVLQSIKSRKTKKIKIKKEVVPMNLVLNSRERNSKSHLDPKEWNELIKNKDTHIIDTRKPFEYKVGTFKKSVNPNIDNFRDFPKYLNKT